LSDANGFKNVYVRVFVGIIKYETKKQKNFTLKVKSLLIK